MSKELRGSRSSKEASVVLSSVTVVARELDTDGAPTGEERNLGSLTVNKDNGTVTLTTPVDGEEVGDGWQVLLREHGRDSQTHQVKVWFETADVPDPDPEPVPDKTAPTVPGNLRDTDMLDTGTGFILAWDPSRDAVGVVAYEVYIDGVFYLSTASVGAPVSGREPGRTYRVDVLAIDEADNQSDSATITVTTPTPEPDPEPEPPTTGTWPAAGTVGFRGNPATLTPLRGGQNRESNIIIENKRIDCTDSGELGIHGDNVTIRNCIIACGGWGIFLYNGADNLVVEDCTFVGGEYAAIGLSQAKNWRVSRCDFSGGNDALKPGGSGVIEDCRMHDPYRGENSHNDCIQFSGDCDGITVRRNYLGGADTSEIAMFDNQGGVYRNVTIENNYLGGAGYAIYAGGEDGHNIVIRNNVFGSYGYQHPVTLWQRKAGNVFTGNTFERNGQTVPEPPHES